MKFERIFLCYDRCAEVALRSDFDEIIHIHADSSSRRHSPSGIIGLVYEAHVFELFHVISDRSRGYLHAFIADKRLTSCCVATFDIFPHYQSENLDFSGIDGGFSGHLFDEL